MKPGMKIRSALCHPRVFHIQVNFCWIYGVTNMSADYFVLLFSLLPPGSLCSSGKEWILVKCPFAELKQKKNGRFWPINRLKLTWFRSLPSKRRGLHFNFGKFKFCHRKIRWNERNEWGITDNRAANDGRWNASVEKREWLTCDGKYVDDNEWWKSVQLKSTQGPEQTVARRNCWLKPHFSTTTSHYILNKNQNNNTHRKEPERN